jgi:prenyl protein peptidase
MDPSLAIFTTIAYQLAIVLFFYTHKYVYPSVSDAVYRLVTFVICCALFGIVMFPLGMWDSFFIFAEPSFSLVAMGATVFLFIGPILQQHWSAPRFDTIDFQSVKAVLISPLGEEFIYRSFTCILWESAGISPLVTIFLSPVLFGLSHFHHFFLGTGSRRRLLFASIGQCGYTTLFGWWVAFLWCRTHGYGPVAVIHAFCNYMNFPDFAGAFNWRERRQRRVLWAAYVVGLAGFAAAVVWLARW